MAHVENESITYARTIADLAVALLNGNHTEHTGVFVFSQDNGDCPVETRVTDNDGFGEDSNAYFLMMQELARQARQQALYAELASGRTAQEQLAYQTKKNRSATSYSVEFPEDLIPSYVRDKKSGLTVVVSSSPDSMKPEECLEVASRALRNAELQVVAQPLLAAEFALACIQNIAKSLPKDRTGIAMLALMTFLGLSENNVYRHPAVVCSDMTGEVLDPKVYHIVKAKALATVMSGYPSGDSRLAQEQQISQIPGAVPVLLQNRTVRVAAAGGLPTGEKDVEAIFRAISHSSKQT